MTMTPEEEAKAVELAEEIKAWLQKYYESRRALDTLVESTRRLVVEHERKVARLEQERDEARRKALEEALACVECIDDAYGAAEIRALIDREKGSGT